MRSYGQYCGLARALDVVGDRWNLLIVRELLLGPARYGELADRLPGIASNLLADRLRDLLVEGVIERELDTERNGARYRLTPWGSELRPAIDALIRWSTPLMAEGQGDLDFEPRWLEIALAALLRDRKAQPPVEVAFATAGTTTVVRVDARGAAVSTGGRVPDTVLAAEPGIVLGLVAGALDLDTAIGLGRLQGDRRDLERLLSA